MTLMDQGAPDELCIPTEFAKAGMERLVTRWHEVDNGRLRYVVTPRFALSCSTAMLEMAGRTLKSMPLQFRHTSRKIKRKLKRFVRHFRPFRTILAYMNPSIF